MSEDIRLRAVEESDLEVFLEQEHDPEAVRRSQFQPRERERFLDHWRIRVLGDPTVFVRAVVIDGELAGNIVSWWVGGERYLGYWLGRAYWGRGIGGRALAKFLELETTRPLYADPVVGNVGSIRILEKCGFLPLRTERHGDNEHLVLALGGPEGDL
ncbi:GNAT family N-acetyltransferase [Nocardiopsis protaetiae]|uniref:GNAT family N-acetyltransferase n=2 Tax=Nocardiopsidaceae TaxID=83676 RepID=UPI00387AE46E